MEMGGFMWFVWHYGGLARAVVGAWQLRERQQCWSLSVPTV